MFLKIISFLIIIPTIYISAGLCTQMPEEYLRTLKRMNPSSSDKDEIWRNLHCLWGLIYWDKNKLIFDYHKHMKEMYKYRHQAIRIIPKYLRSKFEKVRNEAICALAYFRWPGIYSYVLNSKLEPELKAVLFAIIRDRRAITWWVKAFNEYDRKHKNTHYSVNERMARRVFLDSLTFYLSPYAKKVLERIIKESRYTRLQKNKAKFLLKKINKEFPSNFNTTAFELKIKGINLLKRKKSKQAKLILEKALSLKKDGETFYHHGNACMNLNKYSIAVASYLKAWRMGFQKNNAIFNIACAYSLGNNPKKCLKALYFNYVQGDRIFWRIRKDSDLKNFRRSKYYFGFFKSLKQLKKGDVLINNL